MTVVGFVLAAAVGAVLRHLVATGMREARHGILVVNLIGSFVLGLLVGGEAGRTTLVVLGTGFCGALTTWSALAHDVAIEDDRRSAATHIALSLGLGLAAAAAGLTLR